MSEPAWQDGEPLNLPAAAADALEWLRLFRHSPIGHTPAQAKEGRARLEACIAALEKHLAARKENEG